MLVAYMAQETIGGLLFLASFFLLLSFTGGFHLDTYISCNVSVISVFLGYLIVQKLVFYDLNIFIIHIFSVISIVVIKKKAPAEHKNKQLSNHEKVKFGKIATAIALSYYAGAFFMQWRNFRYFVVLHYVIIISAALLIVIQRKVKAYKTSQ